MTMKLAISIFGSLALACSVSGQVLVKYFPPNQPFAGLTNYPSAVGFTRFTTNAPGWDTNMTPSAYYGLLGRVLPGYVTGAVAAGATIAQAMATNPAPISLDSGVWSASSAGTNYGAWLSLNAQMPLGVSTFATMTNSLWGIYQSLTPTNTLAQLTSKMQTLALDEWILATAMRNVCEYLQRMGPGLQQGYDPAKDPAP